MTEHVAIVPSAILRRWDRVACAQLCEVAARLVEERDELRSRLQSADSAADFWQQIAEAERDGREVGITQDGRVVDVPPEQRAEDSRFTIGLLADVAATLERHGYARSADAAANSRYLTDLLTLVRDFEGKGEPR
jgi:hypothetical protein